MYCIECGTQSLADARFCGNCGKKLFVPEPETAIGSEAIQPASSASKPSPVAAPERQSVPTLPNGTLHQAPVPSRVSAGLPTPNFMVPEQIHASSEWRRILWIVIVGVVTIGFVFAMTRKTVPPVDVRTEQSQARPTGAVTATATPATTAPVLVSTPPSTIVQPTIVSAGTVPSAPTRQDEAENTVTSVLEPTQVPVPTPTVEVLDSNEQNRLGIAYLKGDGVKRDAAKAVEWFKKAAEQGNRNAQRNLGVAYLKGVGIAKDQVKAAEWLTKAAEQGDKDAQREVRRAEEVFADPSTGLTWARSDNGSDVDWEQAGRFCRDSRVAGVSEWRLPTLSELSNLHPESRSGIRLPVDKDLWSADKAKEPGTAGIYQLNRGRNFLNVKASVARALCVCNSK